MNSGKDFGGFTVQGPLRCTGVGSLMCAQDKDGARTAIRLVPEHAQGGLAVAAVLRLPLHPVLPRALGSGLSNGSAWVALDFPDGVLVTQKWPLELPQLLAMSAAVSSALAALHREQIIHGELSGDSVLSVPGEKEERFVLFDAPLVVVNRLTDRRGEERLLAQLTHMVPFLSPERARGGEADYASDIWALGVLISLASGAKGVPGSSVLERIATIVTGKWRPSVPGTLPIALRLLLTRMLAPDPRVRPSATEVAAELSSIQEAPQTTAVADAAVQELNESDPFAELVSKGVSVNAPDANAMPTRRVIVPDSAPLARPGHEVTDPHAMLPVPTAPYAPSWEKAVEPKPLQLEQVAQVSVSAPAPIQLETEALLIPAHPTAKRRTQPLPPILDPEAIAVPPVARRMSPAPMAKVVAAAEPEQPSVPQLTTLPFGSLPTKQIVADPPAAVQPVKTLQYSSYPSGKPGAGESDVGAQPVKTLQYSSYPEGKPAAAQAEPPLKTLQFGTQPTEPQLAPPRPMGRGPITASVETAPMQDAMMAETAVDAPIVSSKSIHDELEDAFNAQVARARTRRYIAAGVAVGLLVLAALVLIVRSGGSEEVPAAAVPAPAAAPVVKQAAPVDDDEPVALEPAKQAPPPAKAAPAEPVRSPPPPPKPVAEPARPPPPPAKAAAAEPTPKPAVRKAAPATPANRKPASRLSADDD